MRHKHYRDQPVIHPSRRWVDRFGFMLVIAMLWFGQAMADDPLARSHFQAGNYAKAIEAAEAAQEQLGRFGDDESLPVLIIDSYMANGKFAAALQAVDAALERYPDSIQIRWAAIDVCRFNRQGDRALVMRKEIEQRAARDAWKYRDNANQIVLGKYFLTRGADARQVLKMFYKPALERNPADAEVYRAIGLLAIDKRDFGMAADNFRQVIKMRPDDADANYQLARCYLTSDAEQANAFVNRVFEINPQHVGTLLIAVDQKMNAEDYPASLELLDRIFSVHPSHPVALAYRAAIAHLQNDPAGEAKFRDQALADWNANPEVDHVIGRELSEKYRFSEGQVYQRRALVYDDLYLPARIQLAHDLLRLGQETEGWKLADEVFDSDQYSVLAHNLVALRDQMAGFRTLSRDGFVVRMSEAEADVYGDRVLDLLERASARLTATYQVQLETPIIVEIFPDQQDFAIRTFGLPGGEGFLGVCFGRVITMNSPAAQGASPTSWESVLWHEFCHVVTLQKTNNRMPRWLSEGISVHEEHLADSAWGESLNRKYREMLIHELTPVSQLSGAFMRPATPVHLQFAYYQSSLVVEMLIQEYGAEALNQLLNELGTGTPLEAAFQRHMAPIEVIDSQFDKFANQRAMSYAPDADWSPLEGMPPEPTLTDWEQWNTDHPNHIAGLVAEAEIRIKQLDFELALERLVLADQLCPSDTTAKKMMAACYRKLDRPDDERAVLEQIASLDSDDVALYERLLELTSAGKDWLATSRFAHRLAAINPLIKPPYRYLADAAEHLDDSGTAVKALAAWSRLEPLDRAEVQYRLASAYFQQRDLVNAKRQVLIALEQAPRYRDAHRLLLKIVAQQERP